MTHPPTDSNNTNPTPPVTEPVTPPANPDSNPAPAQPVINLDEVRNLYNSALQAASQRAAAAEAEAERLRNAQPAPPQRTPEEERQEFFDNPRRLIREEMNQIIRPLNEFQQRYTKQEIYNTFLQRAAKLPGFRFINNPLVQQGLANHANQAAQLTEEGLTGAYNMIVGYLFSTGQLSEAAPAPTPAPSNDPPNPNPAPPTNNPPVQPPPNPRPSAPLPPVNTHKTKRRELNEHEKQLARFNNMSEDEYLDFLEMDARDVARSTEVKK